MTISTQASEATFLGNGSNTLFTFSFVADQASDIEVIYTNASGVVSLLNPSVYTLVINAPPLGGLWGIGGSVTYPISGTPIQSGTSLTIRRAVPLTQEVTISNQGPFYPQVVEQALDILELQIQQIADRTGKYRGVWQTNTQYYYGDTVQDGVNGNNTGSIYLCTITNLSGIWANDLAAGDWVFALGIGSPTQYQTEFYTSNPIYPTPMDADAAATAAGGSLVVDSAYAFSANQVFNAPIVRFASKGKWIRTTHTLTFNGVIFAPEQQLFDIVSTPVVFSEVQGTAFARWFGVQADDHLHMYGNPVNLSATDDTVAWQATLGSASLMAQPIEITLPLGVSKVSSALFGTGPVTVVGGTSYSFAGINLRGRGAWNSVLQSYLSTGTMLTLGIIAPPSVLHGNNGYSIRDMGFSSAGTETLLLDINYCRSMTLDNSAFIGGNNRQCDVGRAQNVCITETSFLGYLETNAGVASYKTPIGLTFTTDLAGNMAGPSYINNCAIRDFRNSTHTGYGFKLAGGGGHRIYANEITDNDVGLDIEVNGNTILYNRFETDGIYFTAVASGGNVGNGTVSYPNNRTIVSSSGIAGSPGYIFTFTNATTATVTDPTGASLANMTVGTNYVQQGLTFLFTAGGTPWSAGDVITITGVGDSAVLVGASSRTQFCTVAYNRLSNDNATNIKLVNFVSYGQSVANDNYFVTPLGVVAYFSSDNNNANSQFMRNNGIDVRVQVSDLSISGKIQYSDNLDLSGIADWGVLTANSTTPSVRGLRSADTANTNPTSITYFTGGYNGATLLLRIRDDNTTIVSGSLTGTPGSIVLSGGVNQTFRTGDDLYFTAFTSQAVAANPIWVQVPNAGYGNTHAVSTGTMTILSGNATNANSTGWQQLPSGKWVATFDTPIP